MNGSVFRQVRFGLYAALVIDGILQLLVPFQYQCNVTGEECFACGLRTAVTLFLQGRFSDAYRSNKLIVVIAIMGIVMAADVFHFLYQRQKSKKR